MKMQDDREDAFRRATQEALAFLSGARGPGHLIPSYRLWHYPEPGPYRSWLVLVPRDPEDQEALPWVVERTWDIGEDRARFERDLRLRPRVSPTLREREAWIPAEGYRLLCERAAAIHIPEQFVGGGPSAFVAEHGFEVFLPEVIQCAWNGNLGQAELNTLGLIDRWARDARACLLKCLDSSTPSRPSGL